MTVQFRLVTKLGDISFRPYGDKEEERKKCIRPGGFDNTIKEFNFMRLTGPRQQQHKKVGIRTPYKIKALLNVRHKFLQMPHEIETIAGVLEEGLGDFEKLESEHFGSDDLSYTSKPILQSKLKKAPKTIETNVIKPTIENKPTQSTKQPQEKPKTSPSKPKEESKPSGGYKASKTLAENIPENVTANKPSAEKPKKKLSSRAGGWGGKRTTKIDPLKAFVSKIRFRLNQITFEKFDSLSERLITIFDNEVNDSSKLEKLVRLIFEKTVQEHVYGPLYAKLCVVLSGKNKSFEEVSAKKDKKNKTVDFKAILLKVCQAEFERGKREAKETADMDKTDIENEKIKQKRILMGTMKFIGHLYLVKLLPSKIMTVCLKHLVLTAKPTQDDVEAASTLLRTVGKELDMDEGTDKQELTKCYQKFRNIAGNSSYRGEWIRIKFLLENLLELRKHSWTSTRQIEQAKPSELKQRKDKVVGELDLDAFDILTDNIGDMITGSAMDKTMEMITGSAMPLKGHIISKAQGGGSKVVNRYNSKGQRKEKVSVPREQKQQTVKRRSVNREKVVKRKLVETEPDVAVNVSVREEKKESFKPKKVVKPKVSGGGIGERKIRGVMNERDRACVEGKKLSEDKLNDIMSDYLERRNEMNREKFMETLGVYKLENRQKFVMEFVRKSMDTGKMERLSDVIPMLLDNGVIVTGEMDGAFIEFFKGITYEDDPQLHRNLSQLLAPLIVDNELNFEDVMNWVILDVKENQEEDMLQYYDGDGVRNYMKNKGKITKCLDLLGYLLGELKEACFNDGEYVKKLLVKYEFKIDKYVNKNDIGNKEEIKKEWIEKYKLKSQF